jgi:hypothetical protein
LLVRIPQTCDKTKRVTETFQPRDPDRFAAALRRFDEENTRDPRVEQADSSGAGVSPARNTEQPPHTGETPAPLPEGVAQPRELVYARWLSDWVLRLYPEASEALRLAARCQHVARWRVRRESYPMTRTGYLKWREDLKRFHAEKAGEILREVGYPEEVVARVQRLNLKKDFPHDPEARVLEDALCLVFLEHQFGDLVRKTSEEKMMNALQKAWKKMTPAAQAQALKLTYSPELRELLRKALHPTEPAA